MECPGCPGPSEPRASVEQACQASGVLVLTTNAPDSVLLAGTAPCMAQEPEPPPGPGGFWPGSQDCTPAAPAAAALAGLLRSGRPGMGEVLRLAQLGGPVPLDSSPFSAAAGRPFSAGLPPLLPPIPPARHQHARPRPPPPPPRPGLLTVGSALLEVLAAAAGAAPVAAGRAHSAPGPALSLSQLEARVQPQQQQQQQQGKQGERVQEEKVSGGGAALSAGAPSGNSGRAEPPTPPPSGPCSPAGSASRRSGASGGSPQATRGGKKRRRGAASGEASPAGRSRPAHEPATKRAQLALARTASAPAGGSAQPGAALRGGLLALQPSPQELAWAAGVYSTQYQAKRQQGGAASGVALPPKALNILAAQLLCSAVGRNMEREPSAQSEQVRTPGVPRRGGCCPTTAAAPRAAGLCPERGCLASPRGPREPLLGGRSMQSV